MFFIYAYEIAIFIYIDIVIHNNMLSIGVDFIANVVSRISYALGYFNIFSWCTRPHINYITDNIDDIVDQEEDDLMNLVSDIAQRINNDRDYTFVQLEQNNALNTTPIIIGTTCSQPALWISNTSTRTCTLCIK